jgi:alginate O-acetyltransferase complex protein AlgI
MIFNSVTFILFLVATVILYWTLPNRLKIWLIFLSGLVFYGFWRVEFIPVMLLTAFTDYFIALKIDSLPQTQQKQRLRWLILSFVVNFGLLLYFKYLTFFTTNVNALATAVGLNFQLPFFDIILPLGISFYTFESVCYTVDVYRGQLKPTRDWALYGGFIAFFPKLIAGPILRASEILHQIQTRPPFKLQFITEGVERILVGLFLKVVFADNISSYVDDGFKLDVSQLSAIDVWTLAFMFGFQIYFDFSAYSHIAIGCGKLMGINISENFNFPYLATSFKEFWKRWHISLSTWIRDYLYLPLTGKKVVDRIGSTGNVVIEETETSAIKRNRALFLTWAIMGLWHGANWTFLLWGVYHASMIFFERLLAPLRNKLFSTYPKILGWAVTLPLAMLAWIPFRAGSMSVTLTMFKKVITPSAYTFISMRENTYIVAFCAMLAILITYYAVSILDAKLSKFPKLYFAINTLKYIIVIILVFTFLRPISQFIYFQF